MTLDTKLSQFRPDLPYAERITLKNIANMTSGYADYVYQNELLQGLMQNPFRQWMPEELIKIGGKPQVPCLVIDGKALYESLDIIEWFKRNKKK